METTLPMVRRNRYEMLIKRVLGLLPMSLGILLTVHGLSGLLVGWLLIGPLPTLAPGQAPATLPQWIQERSQAAPWFPLTLVFGMTIAAAAISHTRSRGLKPMAIAQGICNGAIVAGILGVLLFMFEAQCFGFQMRYGTDSLFPPSLLQWLGMHPPFPMTDMIFIPAVALLLLGLLALVPKLVLTVIMRNSDDSSDQACEHCGYLNALRSSRCPECGTKLADST